MIVLLLTLVLAVGVISSGFTFFGFVSKTIYEESTAHLVEIFHQANQALYNLVSVNWSRMRMWAPYLETAENEEDIAAYVKQARKENNFTDFYFISRDGEYLSMEGQRGYLDLGRKLSDLILYHQPVVANSVVPDKPEIMVFAIPIEQGSYQDFVYEAIAITFNNSDVVNASMNKLQSTTMFVVGGIAAVLALLVLLFVIQQNRQKLRRKDNELLARDELFSKLSVNVDDVFLMVDAKKFCVEYVSPNIEKLVGISQEKVLEDIYELEYLIKKDEKIHVLDQMSTVQPGEQCEWDREYIHQKTGEVRWFRVVVFCTDIQGEKKYVLDLSDRTGDKIINQKLEDAVHTAENASRAKTAFLNNMSHDIRTPMNAIIGFTNIAMKHHPKPEVKGCLEKIGESSEHLLTLINDVLDISRIESGKIKFVPTPVDITTVADTVIGIMYGFLSNRNIVFRTNLAEPATPYVLADAVRIREVMVNILGNAVKFTEDGGSIVFEASYHPGEDEQHMVVLYRVADTGVGMSEEFVNHIFDEFSQEENGARTQYKGTGLGMAITKRYVDLMGGQTFVDNDLNAEIAMVQMEDLGIRVTRVSNGNEAVRTFSENPPNTFDLIFMDIMMPEMNGYEATEAIRAIKGRPDARKIPIIAMTANAFAEDVQASLDAGMNGHLSKPIIMEEVVKAIARNLDRFGRIQ